MKTRIWYPQLDVYEAVRRIGVLLSEWQKQGPALERLYIADFYLANPPLLHRVSMPDEIRTEFRKLALPRPEKMFLSYPAAPLLFHKMEPIQKHAVQALIGKGVIDADSVREGRVQLSTFGETFVQDNLRPSITENEQGLLNFLSNCFVNIGQEDVRELRRRTGLRRMV